MFITAAELKNCEGGHEYSLHSKGHDTYVDEHLSLSTCTEIVSQKLNKLNNSWKRLYQVELMHVQEIEAVRSGSREVRSSIYIGVDGHHVDVY